MISQFQITCPFSTICLTNSHSQLHSLDPIVHLSSRRHHFPGPTGLDLTQSLYSTVQLFCTQTSHRFPDHFGQYLAQYIFKTHSFTVQRSSHCRHDRSRADDHFHWSDGVLNIYIYLHSLALHCTSCRFSVSYCTFCPLPGSLCGRSGSFWHHIMTRTTQDQA